MAAAPVPTVSLTTKTSSPHRRKAIVPAGSSAASILRALNCCKKASCRTFSCASARRSSTVLGGDIFGGEEAREAALLPLGLPLRDLVAALTRRACAIRKSSTPAS